MGDAGIDVDTVFSRRAFVTATVGLAGLAIAAPSLAAESSGRIGMTTIERLRERASRLRHLDDYLGGADTYAVYLSELAATKTMLKEAGYSEPVGLALLALACEQGQQAGWAAFDAGWHPEASRLFADARTSAEAAGDTTLVGNSLAYSAYQATMTGRDGTAEAVAAQEAAGITAPGQVRALLLDRAAYAHAVKGQEQEAVRALGQAADALVADGDDQAPHWVRWVDDGELQIMTGRVWVELGRPLRAAPALEAGLARQSDTHARDKSLYLTWLASAYLDGHEPERGVTALRRSMELATGVASVRPQQRITALLPRFGQYRSVPEVADLYGQAETWLSAQSSG